MESQSAAAALPHFVRITGRRRHFIEFDYAVGSPDLAVELIMPADLFHDFCRRRGVTLISAEEGLALDRERATWRDKVIDAANE